MPTATASHATTSPVLSAITDQAIYNATGTNPTFRDEFYDRMSMVMDAADLLQSILENAAFHEFDLSYQHLFGTVRLINRELKTVDGLIDALKESIEAVPEFKAALPNY